MDKENGNTLWEDAGKLELKQIQDYDTIRDMGIGAKLDLEYHKINVHLVFDVKPSGKWKGQLVACGHMTPEPDEAVYSSDASDRIPSTTPGAEPPRYARDSGSARSHSTHLKTSSSDRP